MASVFNLEPRVSLFALLGIFCLQDSKRRREKKELGWCMDHTDVMLLLIPLNKAECGCFYTEMSPRIYDISSASARFILSTGQIQLSAIGL